MSRECTPWGCGPNIMFRPFSGLGVGPEPTPPVNTVAPVVSGVLSVGSTLTCTTGTWDQPSTFTYQWYRDGVAIAGSTNFNRILIGSDFGAMMSCAVTATATVGGQSASVLSNIVGPIAL